MADTPTNNTPQVGQTSPSLLGPDLSSIHGAQGVSGVMLVCDPHGSGLSMIPMTQDLNRSGESGTYTVLNVPQGFQPSDGRIARIRKNNTSTNTVVYNVPNHMAALLRESQLDRRATPGVVESGLLNVTGPYSDSTVIDINTYNALRAQAARVAARRSQAQANLEIAALNAATNRLVDAASGAPVQTAAGGRSAPAASGNTSATLPAAALATATSQLTQITQPTSSPSTSRGAVSTTSAAEERTQVDQMRQNSEQGMVDAIRPHRANPTPVAPTASAQSSARSASAPSTPAAPVLPELQHAFYEVVRVGNAQDSRFGLIPRNDQGPQPMVNGNVGMIMVNDPRVNEALRGHVGTGTIRWANAQGFITSVSDAPAQVMNARTYTQLVRQATAPAPQVAAHPVVQPQQAPAQPPRQQSYLTRTSGRDPVDTRLETRTEDQLSPRARQHLERFDAARTSILAGTDDATHGSVTGYLARYRQVLLRELHRTDLTIEHATQRHRSATSNTLASLPTAAHEQYWAQHNGRLAQAVRGAQAELNTQYREVLNDIAHPRGTPIDTAFAQMNRAMGLSSGQPQSLGEQLTNNAGGIVGALVMGALAFFGFAGAGGGGLMTLLMTGLAAVGGAWGGSYVQQAMGNRATPSAPQAVMAPTPRTPQPQPDLPQNTRAHAPAPDEVSINDVQVPSVPFMKDEALSSQPRMG